MQTRAGIVSLITTIVVLAAGAALVSSCGGKAKPDLLAADITLNEGSYAIGEPIVMTIKVANKAGKMIPLTFPTAQRYDFIVKKGKETVWEWSEGKVFAQVVGRYEIAPGETLSYQYTWDQTVADGTKPGLGAYTVEGLLMLSPPFSVGPKAFGIVD